MPGGGLPGGVLPGGGLPGGVLPGGGLPGGGLPGVGLPGGEGPSIRIPSPNQEERWLVIPVNLVLLMNLHEPLFVHSSLSTSVC